MLHRNFFSIGGSDTWWHVSEVTTDLAIFVYLFLSEEGFSWKSDLLLLCDIADNEDGVGVVAADNLVELDVVLSDAGARRVPAHNPFLWIDASHHVEHLFVVDVVKEPDVWLLRILFEGNCIAVGNIEHIVVSVFAE